MHRVGPAVSRGVMGLYFFSFVQIASCAPSTDYHSSAYAKFDLSVAETLTQKDVSPSPTPSALLTCAHFPGQISYAFSSLVDVIVEIPTAMTPPDL